MALIVGAALALCAGAFARVVGLDRDRAFYPTVTIVVASYYALFAAMGGSIDTLWIEGLAGAVFVIAAAIGFRSSMWVVVAALAGHGIFDFFIHGSLISNPGMPRWWPDFCGMYDIVAALFLAWLIRSARIAPRSA